MLRAALTVSGTFEVQNLTERAAYDALGVPKMGRAFFSKGTVEL